MKRYLLIILSIVLVGALAVTALAMDVTYPMQVLFFTFVFLFFAVVVKALREMLHGEL